MVLVAYRGSGASHCTEHYVVGETMTAEGPSMDIEQIEKLTREMCATELKHGAVYVITYDINKISRRDAMAVTNWLSSQCIPNCLLGRDGEDESISLYKVKDEPK